MHIKNICCIGGGYVGGPTMAVMALKCPDIQVNVVDINKDRIDNWNDKNLSRLPVYEPGLAEIVEKCRGKNLHFSTKVKEMIEIADMIFISVNTPTKTKGLGAGKASDLKWVENSAREVATFSKGHTIVIEKSTLPVRTAEVIQLILNSSQNQANPDYQNKSFDVLSNPEFLAEGTAIEDLLNPDRVLIGGDNPEAIKSLRNIYKKWVPDVKILETNIWSSELAKLTANAFLAQRISSINTIAALCESTGADVREVSRAIGKDSRIGSKFLDSGPGFGGSCFKKDILNLVYLAEYFGLPEIANFWNSVVSINYWHQHRISKLIIKKLFGSLSGKKIGILGFAFKANTNDTRESSAIQICKDLLEEGALLTIHDPKVEKDKIAKDLPEESFDPNTWDVHDSVEKTLINTHAAVILTEWREYSNLDWDRIAKKMIKPSWIFDARSIVDKNKVLNAGLNFWRIGDGSI